MTTVYQEFLKTESKVSAQAFLHIPHQATRGYQDGAVDYTYEQALQAADELSERYAAAGYGRGVRVAVMLDGQCSFETLEPEGISIWWGAYLGLPNEVLRQGLLAEVGPEIVALRDAARAEHGWIMDTYLLERVRN